MHSPNPALTSTPQSTVVLLEPTDRQQLDIERTELLAFLLPEEIGSAQEFEALAAKVKHVDAFVKRSKPSFDKVCASAYDTWKAACGLRTTFFERLEAFSSGGGRLLARWRQKQDELRLQEQRRLEEEERQRQLKAREAEARQLEKQGQKEIAAAVRATPVAPQPVTLPSAVPTVKGLSFRDEWKWRYVNNDRAAAEAVIPREYMSANETKLNGIARSMKGAVKVPGIEFYCEKVPVRR